MKDDYFPYGGVAFAATTILGLSTMLFDGSFGVFLLLMTVLCFIPLSFHYLKNKKKKIEEKERQDILKLKKNEEDKRKRIIIENKNKERQAKREWEQILVSLQKDLEERNKLLKRYTSAMPKTKENLEQSLNKQERYQNIISGHQEEIKIEKKLVSALRKKYPFVDAIVLNRK